MLGATRIKARFDALAAENRAGFVAYIVGGDPCYEASLDLLKALPGAGADIIELGVPFTDPMADGPAIQAASERALAHETTIHDVLNLARAFRETDQATPLVMMGYCNPVHAMGWEAFAKTTAAAGIDGVITVDLPPEEDAPLRAALTDQGLALIRLATPTTDAARLPAVVADVSGFVYYVSVAGVTGGALGASGDVSAAVAQLRKAAHLPVAVGFGVKKPDQAASIARAADAVVVGSAIVEAMAHGGTERALHVASELSAAIHGARKES